MKLLRRLVVTSIVTLASPIPARAECATLQIADEFDRSTAIFVGRAVSQAIALSPAWSWPRATETTFEIETLWKGEHRRTLRVQTCGGVVGGEAITCSEAFRFHVGAKYIVFADGTPLTTNTCHHTALVDETVARETLQWLSKKSPAYPTDRDYRTNASERDAAAVYARIISAEPPPPDGKPILIAAQVYRPRAGECRPTTDTDTHPWRSTIDNYVAISQAKRVIPRVLPLPPTRYAVLTPADFSRQFGKKRVSFLLLSAVGFDPTGTKAIVHRVHVCAHVDCGDANDLFLEKRDGEWRAVPAPDGVSGCGWIT
jgi:hypothetical protein